MPLRKNICPSLKLSWAKKSGVSERVLMTIEHSFKAASSFAELNSMTSTPNAFESSKAFCSVRFVTVHAIPHDCAPTTAARAAPPAPMTSALRSGLTNPDLFSDSATPNASVLYPSEDPSSLKMMVLTLCRAVLVSHFHIDEIECFFFERGCDVQTIELQAFRKDDSFAESFAVKPRITAVELQFIEGRILDLRAQAMENRIS